MLKKHTIAKYVAFRANTLVAGAFPFSCFTYLIIRNAVSHSWKSISKIGVGGSDLWKSISKVGVGVSDVWKGISKVGVAIAWFCKSYLKYTYFIFNKSPPFAILKAL